MKAEIEHACGHVTTVNLAGTNVHGERGRTAQWLATQNCPTCARQERKQQREDANAEAAATSAERGWPDLVGTPKQRAWATTVRADAVQAMHDRLTARCTPEVAEQSLQMWTAAALRQLDASWWIDHRDRILASVNSLVLTPEELAELRETTARGAQR